MIRNDAEFEEVSQRFKEEEERLTKHREKFKAKGLKKDEIERAMAPLRSFHLQLGEEIEHYKRLKRGQFDEIVNLHGIGQLLISLRISCGLSQRELAERLGVHESQVSRDERNEYHGITVERAMKILDAIGSTVVSRVQRPKGRQSRQTVAGSR